MSDELAALKAQYEAAVERLTAAQWGGEPTEAGSVAAIGDVLRARVVSLQNMGSDVRILVAYAAALEQALAGALAQLARYETPC